MDLFGGNPRLYSTRMSCLAVLSISVCLFGGLLQLIKSNHASDGTILISLAGCSFFGIGISLFWNRYVTELAVSMVTEDQLGSACPICWSDFEVGEQVSHGPKCNHMFHATCIQTCMVKHQHRTCPICRCSLGERIHYGLVEELFRPR